MLQDKESLKTKLKSVTKLKLCKSREEFELRNTERILTEELRSTQTDTESMALQLEDLKQDISKIKYQVSMIGICEASEKSKIENHINTIVNHRNDFHELFSKEQETMENNILKIKKQHELEREAEQQKEKIIEDKIQLTDQEAKKIEEECDAIEKECVVLKKRNHAIMLKLRRKLIDSEDIRRQLMNGGESTEPKIIE